jgi:hypothetical protein
MNEFIVDVCKKKSDKVIICCIIWVLIGCKVIAYNPEGIKAYF